MKAEKMTVQVEVLLVGVLDYFVDEAKTLGWDSKRHGGLQEWWTGLTPTKRMGAASQLSAIMWENAAKAVKKCIPAEKEGFRLEKACKRLPKREK